MYVFAHIRAYKGQKLLFVFMKISSIYADIHLVPESIEAFIKNTDVYVHAYVDAKIASLTN